MVNIWLLPMGSMYGIYANTGGILMGSMLPYIAYMDPMGYMVISYYMVIIWLLYGYYMVIIWLLYGYYMAIIWLLYGYYMVIIWLLYGYYMVIIWLYGQAGDITTMMQFFFGAFLRSTPEIWAKPWANFKAWKARAAGRRVAPWTLGKWLAPFGLSGWKAERLKRWVCLKIGYIPNYSHLIGIMIINHWV